MTPGQIAQSLVSTLSNLKTGWKTSEFWVALTPIVVGALGVFGVHLSNGSTATVLTAVWGAVSTIYIAGRTYLKTVHIGHAANLTAVLKQLEAEGKVVLQDVAGTAQTGTAPVLVGPDLTTVG